MPDEKNTRGKGWKKRDRTGTGLRELVNATAPKKRPRNDEKPTHYKIFSICLYIEDIERLDTMVAWLKKNGHPKANRSTLMRFMIDTVDISKMPKSY